MSNPALNISNAINAYNDVAGGKKPSMTPHDAVDGTDFVDLVKGAIKEAQRIGEVGEQQSVMALDDKADLSQVVTAVAEAELTLQTVVAVRDKVLEAYQDIIRMPI